jgi:large subunit ribosomal protein L24
LKNKDINMALARLRKGDDVIVRSGKHRGKTGVVEKVVDRGAKVVIKGINVVKRHVGKRYTGGEGTIVEVAKPLPAAIVQLVDSEGNAVKVRVEEKDGVKVRVSKKDGSQI